ncbi:MAG: N-acetylmuramoyl-L-alanine amidase [Salinivirgaceae bacterium]|nr:N-acetylmuramoyl-L-alanine amidase [Salinivirgaceae bacterium]
MMKKILLVLIILVGIVNIQVKGTSQKRQKIVVIDAGHGGKDTGATGKKAKEKDIVLAISLKVGKFIQDNMPDVKVIYTRETDVFIPLRERAMIANNNNADLFISIHANANKSHKPFGTETFAMGLHKTQGNLDVAKKENSVIVFEEDYSTKYEGFDPSSAESYIIFSLMQNTYLQQSLSFASYVQEQFTERAKRKDRGVKQAGFLVLWNTSMPSVLVETGFISNEDEEKYLMSNQGQDYLASAIYRAVRKYIAEKMFTNFGSSDTSNIKNSGESYDKEGVTNINAQNKIVFRVQVASSSNAITKNHSVFKNYTSIFEYQENNMYKYSLGEYQDYEEVKKFANSVKKDFPGAFVVAFKNDNKITIKEALHKK